MVLEVIFYPRMNRQTSVETFAAELPVGVEILNLRIFLQKDCKRKETILNSETIMSSCFFF